MFYSFQEQFMSLFNHLQKHELLQYPLRESEEVESALEFFQRRFWVVGKGNTIYSKSKFKLTEQNRTNVFLNKRKKK